MNTLILFIVVCPFPPDIDILICPFYWIYMYYITPIFQLICWIMYLLIIDEFWYPFSILTQGIYNSNVLALNLNLHLFHNCVRILFKITTKFTPYISFKSDLKKYLYLLILVKLDETELGYEFFIRVEIISILKRYINPISMKRLRSCLVTKLKTKSY